MTRVCIVGAGAIGGFLGTRLALAGDCQVSALARGATLAALQQHGWRLDQDGQRFTAPARVADRADALGPQDLVIVAVKAHALSGLAPELVPLLGERTVVLPAMNGVPWWFCEGRSDLPGGPLDSVDPGGRIARAIAFERVLGCVVHASCATPEPGLVQHQKGHGLIIGEPRGGRSERAQAVCALLTRAGFETRLSEDVRHDAWYKLWGNMTMNPVSAITGASIDRVLADPLVRGFCSAAMGEASAIGARIGCPIDQSAEDRHAVTARLGAFRTSMLQDADAGRPIELDALVGAVREMGQRLGVATPTLDGLMGLARLFGRVRGLYPPA